MSSLEAEASASCLLHGDKLTPCGPKGPRRSMTSELNVVADPCEVTCLGQSRLWMRTPRWCCLEGRGSNVHPGT